MSDAEDVRRLALALPHVEEIDCDGFDFRVGGKGFVWSYPERQPGQGRVLRTDIAVLYVGDEAEKQALVLGEPALFFTTPGYDGWPLVMLRLDEVDAGRLAELITDAWRMRAPAELAAEFEGSGLGTRPGRGLLRLSWLIRAMRLIRCTIDPPINHEARINHLSPARKTDKEDKLLRRLLQESVTIGRAL